MKKRFTLKARLNSFANAFRGIGIMLREEHNAWIHCAAAVLVTVAGLLTGLSRTEWIAIVFAIGMVLGAEALNTSVERLSDVVQPERDERIRRAKDLSAGAVLFCAIAAAIVGLIIFLPKWFPAI
jgi:diacylglycerol kinase (ATP)